MAPFERGRAPRGGHRPRGTGGAKSRGSGQGKGRGALRSRGGAKKSTFISTRVEEPLEIGSDVSAEIAGADEEDDEALADDLSSHGEGEEIEKATVKPYTALLQSLNASIQRGQPQKKRRKVENDTMAGKDDRGGGDNDFVDEAEDETNDADDADDLDEANNAEASGFSLLIITING